MINPLSEQLRQHNGEDCFNDEKDRNALRKFLLHDKAFQKFVKNQFNLTAPIDELRNDPLGLYKVDLGLYRNNVLLGLLEVDHYKEWNPDWPYWYRYCHALVRKLKYWKKYNLPYIACTFNMQHDKILVSTNEMQAKYMYTKTRKPCNLNGEDVMDWFLEIPLPVAKKFGNWTKEELRRVS
jgi:hypothetical protein